MKHDISKHGSLWKEQLYTPDAPKVPSSTADLIGLAVWLDNLVMADLLSWEQAHDILIDHYLRIRRIVIYRLLCSYIDKRIEQERAE